MRIFLFIILFIVNIYGGSYLDYIISDLQKNDKILSIKPVKSDSLRFHIFEIIVKQKLDHFSNNDKRVFPQRIYFTYIDSSRPNVIVTEGYNIYGSFRRELTKLLDANQVVVEHRFFDRSRPDTIDWSYLNIKQEAADYHFIINIFKKYLKHKWVSTGRSKGGQTTLFYRRFYPNDVYASVPYVAPFNFALEDKRIDEFINSVGDADCRQKIHDFQIKVLDNEDSCLMLFKEWADSNKITFNKIGYKRIFEYAVLEYPFTFWQWGNSDCSSIPFNKDDPEILFDHLKKVIPFRGYYSDKSVESSYPAFYQFCTELGYYGYYYNSKDVLSKLKYIENPSNMEFLPPGVDVKFNSKAMNDIKKWVDKELEKFIFIYGELDPWRATEVQIPDDAKECYKFILKGGNHRVRILDFPLEKRKQIFDILERWFDIKIDNMYKQGEK